jgi:hypothetical protein
MASRDDFTAAYIESLLWASTDDNGAPLDSNYGPEDISPEALADIARECAAFQSENAADIETGPCRAGRSSGPVAAGHDFFLTRNGHGAGFWDGDWPGGAGERLTAAAKAAGSSEPYVGDDGRIYIA